MRKYIIWRQVWDAGYGNFLRELSNEKVHATLLSSFAVLTGSCITQPIYSFAFLNKCFHTHNCKQCATWRLLNQTKFHQWASILLGSAYCPAQRKGKGKRVCIYLQHSWHANCSSCINKFFIKTYMSEQSRTMLRGAFEMFLNFILDKKIYSKYYLIGRHTAQLFASFCTASSCSRITLLPWTGVTLALSHSNFRQVMLRSC